jgi:CheY-like chemotaxis protein
MVVDKPSNARWVSKPNAVVLAASIQTFKDEATRSTVIGTLEYIIEKYGAISLGSDADFLLAAFNVPMDVPVPAYLAVMCALEMEQVFLGLHPTPDSDYGCLSIGIDKGSVTITSAAPPSYEAEGEPIHISRELTQLGICGEVVLSPIVYNDVSMLADTLGIVAHSEEPSERNGEPVYRLSASQAQPLHVRHLSSVIPARHGSQVLIGEDDPALRALFAKVLKNAGFSVTVAHNGYETLHHLRQNLPDVLVVDWGLPVISGGELIRQVRALPTSKPVYIVLVTGNHLALQSAEAEMVDLTFIKPISPRDLVNFVKRFIS